MAQYIINGKVGSDVEFFVAKPDGTVVSAEGFIPGTKENPKPFGSSGYATQLDNVLAEGNIPPAMSYDRFAAYIKTLRGHMDKNILKAHGLKTLAIPSFKMADEFLQTENAKKFGCDESLNAWTLETEVVTPDVVPNLRTAGFHVHIGYDNPSKEVNVALARLMDVVLGLQTVLKEPASDRSKLGYGRSGSFRHQPHGMEYRTLSSWWADKPSRVAYVGYAALQCASALNLASAIDILKQVTAIGKDVQQIINTRDKKQATALLAEHKMVIERITPASVSFKNFAAMDIE